MQTVTGFANRMVDKVQLEYADFSAMQKKGLIYIVICHIGFILYAVSTFRTICTKPGYVPSVNIIQASNIVLNSKFSALFRTGTQKLKSPLKQRLLPSEEFYKIYKNRWVEDRERTKRFLLLW